jgi:hypothetical protein
VSKTLAGHTGGEGAAVGRVSLVSPSTGLAELSHESLWTGALLHPCSRVSSVRSGSSSVQLNVVNETNTYIIKIMKYILKEKPYCFHLVIYSSFFTHRNIRKF